MTKKINPNLTAEQKLVLFEDGTEPPNTSELNQEKREGSFHCANCGKKNYLTQKQNMKVVLVGHLSTNHFLMFSKLKLIIYWAMQELNIIAKNVVGIMDIFLRMGQIQLENDIVITEYV